MKTIYIVALEPLETRYTCQWYEGLPNALRDYVELKQAVGKQDDVRVVNISGNVVKQDVTTGAFINFAGTNIWKAEQLIEISRLFSNQEVKDGDHFLFTDAWNPAIIQVRYMIDLLGVNAKLSGIWHAGSYDPQDFLGRLVKDKRWSLGSERAIFHALDHNIFATEFHKNLFIENVLGIEPYPGDFDADLAKDKIVISGQPHEHLVETLKPYAQYFKRDLILFPHRVAPEKQPELFKQLAAMMPQYEWVICQEQKLSKDQYHELLGQAKIVFSANLQETLGISAMEGVLVNALPCLPDRLSYSEMYEGEFLYHSGYTEDATNFDRWKNILAAMIKNMIENYDAYQPALERQKKRLLENYLSADMMFEVLLK